MTASTNVYHNTWFVADHYLHLIFPQRRYTGIIFIEIIVIIILVCYFMSQNISRLYWYYLTVWGIVKPSISKASMNLMDQERILLTQYNNAKRDYKLQCGTDDTLQIVQIVGSVPAIQAKTFSGDLIYNCNRILS